MVGFADTGWAHFPADPALLDWTQHARTTGQEILKDPDQRAKWLQCQGTWFVGVDSLPNDPTGALPGTGPLRCAALDMAERLYGPLPLHRGQLSVTWPSYPRPRRGESAAAFRYRRNRDAAHLDGLLAIGPGRRRMLREPHAWILGIPLNTTPEGASPLVVWEGSHLILTRTFHDALNNIDSSNWPDTDLTDLYHTTRRRIFETCKRVEITAQPGECYLIHRHTLHGIAPWTVARTSPETQADGRMIAYFRPQFPPDTRAWITAP